jgi:DNA-binding NtrC family response regulator
MSEKKTVLVVEDDAAMRELLEDELGDAGYAVLTAGEGGEALAQIARRRVDAVITDLRMPGMPGRDLLEEIRLREPGVPVLIITAFGSIDAAVDAVKAGAYHFISKPFQIAQLLTSLEEAIRDRERERDLARFTETVGRSGIVAECHAMKKMLDLVRRAARADTPVLLLGESGTGKELIAKALHEENAARKGRFVAVNCSAIPESLLESQLFGHRRGAFTDAREDRLGLFQEADGGTIFLDEIGDMPHALQGKLLRVLQENEVLPLGASVPVPIDVRVIAATHRDLEESVREGRFRQDFYYRLNVIVIRIPPLRDRREDLLPLIAHFLNKYGERLGRSGVTVSPEALTAMFRHPWPGNVRELENVIERALVLGRRPVIGVEDLPDSLWRPSPIPPAEGSTVGPMAQIEREHILRTLRSVAGNKAAAARVLGVDRKTLYRKLKAYGIDPRLENGDAPES